jgi:type II secretory pathway component GspD/PulD (secretin)
VATVLNAAFQSKPAVAASDFVVIAGSKNSVEKMLKLAADVDQPLPKVRISATFVEVSSSDSNGLGVSVLADVLGARLGIRVPRKTTSAMA